jgi:hypothetical protein
MPQTVASIRLWTSSFPQSNYENQVLNVSAAKYNLTSSVVTERVVAAAITISQPILKESTMMKRPLMMSTFATALLLTTGFALAVDQAPAQEKAKTQKQVQVYGSQLMTKEERTEYRAKMHAAKTAEEREQIRNEHHERMKVRAQERGVTLPDEPPVRGGGMGPRGAGMEAGGGMGPGGGRNR